MGIILKSSIWVTIRNILSIAIRAVGMLFIFKIIRPDEYGSYSAYLGFASISAVFAQMGLNVFIVQKSDVNEKLIKSCIALGIISSTVVFIVSFVIALFINFRDVVLVVLMLSFIPFKVLGLIPIGLLEKNFKFKEAASVDLTSQLLMYISTILLLYAGLREYALMSGFVLMNIVYTILLFKKAKLPLKLCIDKEDFKEILRFGSVYSASNIANQARNLIPIIMSSMLPLQQVGVAMFSSKVSENLNIIRDTVGKIATTAFCSMDTDKIKDNLHRYSMLSGFSIFVIYYVGIKMVVILVPILLGDKWNDSFCLLPFLAISSIFSTISLIHASLFIAQKRVKISSFFFVIQNMLLLIGVYFFITQKGLIGYGYGFLSFCVSFIFSCYYTKKNIGNFLTFELILFLGLSSTIFLLNNIYIELIMIGILCMLPTIRLNSLQLLCKLRKSKMTL